MGRGTPLTGGGPVRPTLMADTQWVAGLTSRFYKPLTSDTEKYHSEFFYAARAHATISSHGRSSPAG
jgi:hypothetical protein